jgi:hypothetical protein
MGLSVPAANGLMFVSGTGGVSKTDLEVYSWIGTQLRGNGPDAYSGSRSGSGCPPVRGCHLKPVMR